MQVSQNCQRYPPTCKFRRGSVRAGRARTTRTRGRERRKGTAGAIPSRSPSTTKGTKGRRRVPMCSRIGGVRASSSRGLTRDIAVRECAPRFRRAATLDFLLVACRPSGAKRRGDNTRAPLEKRREMRLSSREVTLRVLVFKSLARRVVSSRTESFVVLRN